jgi:hypothetical protein
VWHVFCLIEYKIRIYLLSRKIVFLPNENQILLMKLKHFFPILVLLFFGCEKENIVVNPELPPNISVLKPVENLVDSLKVFLPDNVNAFKNHPALFSDTVQKNIVLLKESNVFVTFVDENAGYLNSLCWYSYDKTQPPLKVGDIKGNVVFPNISKKGEGGLLEPGYTLQLGTEKFPAGTVIGFFLVVQGWNGTAIDYSKPIHYTNYNLNIGGKQQHVLFKNTYSHYVVLGFEDMIIDQNSDVDCNDILIAVSDNKEGFEATSFDLAKVINR